MNKLNNILVIISLAASITALFLSILTFTTISKVANDVNDVIKIVVPTPKSPTTLLNERLMEDVKTKLRIISIDTVDYSLPMYDKSLPMEQHDKAIIESYVNELGYTYKDGILVKIETYD